MMRTTNIPSSKRSQSGLSLIELMVSITLGLLILAGVVTIFANNSRTRDEIEQKSRQIENGRYAMQLLTEDLQMAGYLGEYVPSSAATSLPDPCATDATSLQSAMLTHIQGYNDVSATDLAALTCLSDVKTGTDIVVIRRAATCAALNWNTTTSLETGCEDVVTNAPYLQVSGCETEINAGNRFRLNTDLTQLTLRRIGCSTTSNAAIRRFLTRIYFIAQNNNSGDGIPTLKRAELGAGTFSIIPLAAGIDNLQLQYGVDTTASPGDGIPDSYLPDGSTAAPSTIAQWSSVMSVKLGLLARNENQSLDYTDIKEYQLPDKTINALNDHYRRHAYSAMVKLANPAGRREQ